MQEVTGNIWSYHNSNWIVITTNGFVKNNGEAVMGRGVALQAAKNFPGLPLALGSRIKLSGNHVHEFEQYRLLTFPVKHYWGDMADLQLIERSLEELVTWADNNPEVTNIFLPRPGCGNGQLLWADVKPLLQLWLGPRFTVVQLP